MLPWVNVEGQRDFLLHKLPLASLMTRIMHLLHEEEMCGCWVEIRPEWSSGDGTTFDQGQPLQGSWPFHHPFTCVQSITTKSLADS